MARFSAFSGADFAFGRALGLLFAAAFGSFFAFAVSFSAFVCALSSWVSLSFG